MMVQGIGKSHGVAIAAAGTVGKGSLLTAGDLAPPASATDRRGK